MPNRVSQTFGIDYPIIQGGLAYLAFAELAAAVSNAGGLGQITATFFKDAERLRAEIRKVKQLTTRPFGINFALGRRPVDHFVDVAIEEEVPAISVTAGNPSNVFQQLEGTDIKKLVLVASVRQAQKAEELGADAVIVVGTEGGGHLGRDDVGTIVLVPKVAAAVSIPVLASGGLVDGRGYAAALALGAEGIEMGTRFIATKECIAHPRYKEAIVNARENETIIIKKSIGIPARGLRSEATEKIAQMEEKGATFEELWPYINGEANQKFIQDGDAEEGFGWAGQGVGLIDDIPSVKQLFDNILEEAQSARKRLDDNI
ncbi:NAD(P)H-dependent flavin oxidoreductase [Salicibibacter kimchii]|uniref:Probable nitronate monooxygenase n=1 Tax=Salicibibacter kimchii TaxID=2099786 RepID=A0A345BW67_9BACI|nr:nitronate monooxygenase [Salicibibacter kimchii]AXF55198.1 nitronate monooxygenase [Salicibibacter kimchii]